MLKKNGKSPVAIKIIWGFVKPLDLKLIKYEFYANRRNKLRKQYHRLIGRNVRSDFFVYYTENYNEYSVDECLIVLDSFWGRKLTCNPYAIYREIVKRDVNKKYRFVWVKSSSAIVPEDIASNSRVDYVEYNTPAYAHALLTAKFLISNANFIKPFVKKKEQVYLATWHGVPLKTVGFYSKEGNLFPISNSQRNFNSADIVITGSDYSTRLIPLAYKSRCHNVWEIGHPRIDMTLNADRDALRERLGVNSGVTMVLYAPTYRGAIVNVKDNFDLELSAIDALCGGLSDQYEIYVSAHNYVLSKLSRKLKGIKLVPSNIDTNEFLAAVDVLVSDYSSISIDFLALNRPVILYVPDLEVYKAERGLHQNLRDMPVSVCETPDELLKSVVKQAPPSDYKCYSDFINLMIPNDDGSASRRAVDLLFSSDLSDLSLKIKYNKNEAYVSKAKLRLLVYPGNLSPTAETRSFIAFSRLIDYSKYELYYLVDSRNVDRKTVVKANFDEVDERAIPILRSHEKLFSKAERTRYKAITGLSSKKEAGADELVSAAFEREARRVFGGLEYDLAIDFLGSSYFFSRLITSVKTKYKVLLHHQDVFANTFGDEGRASRKTIFKKLSNYKAYRYFDCVVSLNEEDKNSNANNMRGFYSGDVSHHEVNLDFNQSCNSHLKSLVNQSLLQDDVESKLNALKGVKFFVHLSAIDPDYLEAFLSALSYFDEHLINVSLLIYGAEAAINRLELKIEAIGLSDRVICCTEPDHYLSLATRSDFAVITNAHGRLGIYVSEFHALGIQVIDLNVLIANLNVAPLDITGKYITGCPIDELTVRLIGGLQSYVMPQKSDSVNKNLGLLSRQNSVKGSNSIDHFLTKIVTFMALINDN